MKGHAQTDIQERTRSFEEVRQEMQGRLPKGPFEFVGDLTFDEIDPESAATPLLVRFQMALKRDCRYATARGPYLRVFGLSQSMRSIYDGGVQLIGGSA